MNVSFLYTAILLVVVASIPHFVQGVEIAFVVTVTPKRTSYRLGETLKIDWVLTETGKKTPCSLTDDSRVVLEVMEDDNCWFSGRCSIKHSTIITTLDVKTATYDWTIPYNFRDCDCGQELWIQVRKYGSTQCVTEEPDSDDYWESDHSGQAMTFTSLSSTNVATLGTVSSDLTLKNLVGVGVQIDVICWGRFTCAGGFCVDDCYCVTQDDYYSALHVNDVKSYYVIPTDADQTVTIAWKPTVVQDASEEDCKFRAKTNVAENSIEVRTPGNFKYTQQDLEIKILKPNKDTRWTRNKIEEVEWEIVSGGAGLTDNDLFYVHVWDSYYTNEFIGFQPDHPKIKDLKTTITAPSKMRADPSERTVFVVLKLKSNTDVQFESEEFFALVGEWDIVFDEPQIVQDVVLAPGVKTPVMFHFQGLYGLDYAGDADIHLYEWKNADTYQKIDEIATVEDVKGIAFGKKSVDIMAPPGTINSYNIRVVFWLDWIGIGGKVYQILEPPLAVYTAFSNECVKVTDTEAKCDSKTQNSIMRLADGVHITQIDIKWLGPECTTPEGSLEVSVKLIRDDVDLAQEPVAVKVLNSFDKSFEVPYRYSASEPLVEYMMWFRDVDYPNSRDRLSFEVWIGGVTASSTNNKQLVYIGEVVFIAPAPNCGGSGPATNPLTTPTTAQPTTTSSKAGNTPKIETGTHSQAFTEAPRATSMLKAVTGDPSMQTDDQTGLIIGAAVGGGFLCICCIIFFVVIGVMRTRSSGGGNHHARTHSMTKPRRNSRARTRSQSTMQRRPTRSLTRSNELRNSLRHSSTMQAPPSLTPPPMSGPPPTSGGDNPSFV